MRLDLDTLSQLAWWFPLDTFCLLLLLIVSFNHISYWAWKCVSINLSCCTIFANLLKRCKPSGLQPWKLNNPIASWAWVSWWMQKGFMRAVKEEWYYWVRQWLITKAVYLHMSLSLRLDSPLPYNRVERMVQKQLWVVDSSWIWQMGHNGESHFLAKHSKPNCRAST